jgi:hypothetical protein
VDTPLAWTLAVVPSGRSPAHSLLTAAVLLWVLARVLDGRQSVVFAFGLGYVLSDIGPELFVGLVGGKVGQLDWPTYLLWPMLPFR